MHITLFDLVKTVFLVLLSLVAIGLILFGIGNIAHDYAAFDWFLGVLGTLLGLVILIVGTVLGYRWRQYRRLSAAERRVADAQAAQEEAEAEIARAKVERERAEAEIARARADRERAEAETVRVRQRLIPRDYTGAMIPPSAREQFYIWRESPPTVTVAEESPTALLTPQVIRFSEVVGQINARQTFIGQRADRSLRFGPWEDIFKACFFLGLASSGKTNSFTAAIGGAVRMGARIVPNDPHAHKPDSLFRKILPLQGALFPGATFAITHQAIFQNIRLVREELERRVDGGDMHVPVLLIMEEMGRMIRDKEIAQEIAVVLQALSEEGRGFNVFVIAGGQNVIGREFAIFRRSFISSLVHRAQEDNARIFIPQYAKAALSLPVGTAFVTDADGQTERLAQALITRQDIEALSGMRMSDAEIDDWLRNQPRSPVVSEESHHLTVPAVGNAGNARVIGREQPGERAGTNITPFPQQAPIGPGDPITERERAQIEILARQGFSARRMKKALGLSSRRYWIIPTVLKELGIVIDEAEEEEQTE